MGEVKSPGTKSFSADRITILDALAAAGDLSDRGRRDNITVIREEAGQKKSASRNRDAVRKLWVDLLAVQLPTQYRKWSASTSGLRCFFWFQQSAICFFDRKFRS
jgi:protein involved in polysaccharide export with SLBB domain